MQLEGVVTNVTNFGAFVDIGVHQDGLVHISALSEKFVKDPYEVVKAGDIVRVKVMEVDIPRNRVALSMRMGDTPGEKVEGPRGGARGSKPGGNTISCSAMPWPPRVLIVEDEAELLADPRLPVKLRERLRPQRCLVVALLDGGVRVDL